MGHSGKKPLVRRARGFPRVFLFREGSSITKKNVLLIGVGEGVHVLTHIKEKSLEGVTTISIHEEAEVLDSVRAHIKLPLKKGRLGGHKVLIKKLIDYADLIVVLCGYDSHKDIAYDIARTARKEKKITVGILTPDMEKEENNVESSFHKKVGKRMDCLVGVDDSAITSLQGYKLSHKRQKWIVRKHLAGLTTHTLRHSDLAFEDDDKGYMVLRKNITKHVSDGVWRANNDYQKRTRGMNTPHLIKFI